MNILGIETSCDETSASVLADGVVRSNIISSQLVHREFGGVVPELASRAHQRLVVSIVDEALRTSGVAKERLDGIAATYGPGLVGALLVGLNFGKALAYGLGIPFIGVNHLEGHLYSNLLEEPKPRFPLLCLIVSGGHTMLVLVHEPFRYNVLGETLDDAAGEAYDKVAKMLGLGFPGGPMVDEFARQGNPQFVKFPRSFLHEDNYDFSFSGIKTSVLYWLRDHGHPVNGADSRAIDVQLRADLCASFQVSVVDVLAGKTMRAVEEFCVNDVAVAGGVSANSALRRRIQEHAAERNFRLYIPRSEYCTDNGAMVALVGSLKLARGLTSGFDLNAAANLSL